MVYDICIDWFSWPSTTFVTVQWVLWGIFLEAEMKRTRKEKNQSAFLEVTALISVFIDNLCCLIRKNPMKENRTKQQGVWNSSKSGPLVLPSLTLMHASIPATSYERVVKHLSFSAIAHSPPRKPRSTFRSIFPDKTRRNGAQKSDHVRRRWLSRSPAFPRSLMSNSYLGQDKWGGKSNNGVFARMWGADLRCRWKGRGHDGSRRCMIYWGLWCDARGVMWKNQFFKRKLERPFEQPGSLEQNVWAKRRQSRLAVD